MITVNVEAKGITRVRDHLNRIQTNLPKALEKDTSRVTDVYVEEMRREVTTQNLKWSGTLESSIVKKKISAKSYGIMVPKYAHYLDKMKTHWVSVYKHPILFAWANAKLDTIPRAIQVRAHPWIRNAITRGNQRLNGTVANGETTKVIRGK